jgi:hypothetical protein
MLMMVKVLDTFFMSIVMMDFVDVFMSFDNLWAFSPSISTSTMMIIMSTIITTPTPPITWWWASPSTLEEQGSLLKQ